jgi:phosphoglycerate-specific signal transduction histidine kinase
MVPVHRLPKISVFLVTDSLRVPIKWMRTNVQVFARKELAQMCFFANLSVERKIVLGFSLSSLLCLIISVISFLSLSRVNKSTVDIDTNWMPSVRILGDIRYQTATMHRAVSNHALCDSADCQQQYSQLYEQAKEQYSKSRESYAPLISSEEEKSWLLIWIRKFLPIYL